MRIYSIEAAHPIICEPDTERRDQAGYDVKRQTLCPNEGADCLILRRRLFGVAISEEFTTCALGYIPDVPPDTVD